MSPCGEMSEWLKVQLSKSCVRKHRGFKSHSLRHPGFDFKIEPIFFQEVTYAFPQTNIAGNS